MLDNKNYELIKFEDGDFSLDVNVSPNEDTVWLNRHELSLLFDRDIKTIGKHINNILKEEYKNVVGVIAKIATTASDGKTYVTEFYNLDIILSVGYRVKSERGIIFRRWANSILKQYLLNGHVVNPTRCLAHSDNMIRIENTINIMKEQINDLKLTQNSMTSTNYFKDKIFYNGELLEGYSFIKKLFNKATNRIIIIDAYLDYSVLEMLSNINIEITIYINDSSPITNKEIELFKVNHNLNVIRTNLFHDRFIIIDDELYNIGSSIKDIGKKISHISKLESINIEELLNK